MSDAPIIVQSPVCAGMVDTILEIKNPISKHVILYLIFFNSGLGVVIKISIRSCYISCSLKEFIMYSNGVRITS